MKLFKDMLPLKSGNQAPFINKKINKEMRSRLRNKFLNAKSGKAVKRFFTDKIKTKSKITLIEKNIASQEGQEKIVSEKIITEDQAAVEFFNKFFINIVPNLKISTDHGYDNDFIATDDQVTNAVSKFRNHSSIIMIKNRKKMIKVFLLVP